MKKKLKDLWAKLFGKKTPPTPADAPQQVPPNDKK